ncbi:uncharacterized protein [Pyxicephalus adspersus]|uniref:uncharacterized protein n=1 Tax=Pyxicephalus adspersus TaxID=30357 RepID=UPI003B58C12F
MSESDDESEPRVEIKTQLETTDDDPRRPIRNFRFNNREFGDPGFQRLVLQTFGYVGHGKSSFINTCKAVWENKEYINHTKISGSYEGDTTDRQIYQLTDNIVLVDNRGFKTIGSDVKAQIYAQLGNLLPLSTIVDWSQGLTLLDQIDQAELLVKKSDFIVPIFIYSVCYSPDHDEIQELKEFLNFCSRITGMEVKVVLTHKAEGDVEAVKTMFMDLEIENLFSLENITPQNPLKSEDIENSVINFLYSVVKEVEFKMNHIKKFKMIGGKMFVLNYIYKKNLDALENTKEQKAETFRKEEHIERLQELREKLAARLIDGDVLKSEGELKPLSLSFSFLRKKPHSQSAVETAFLSHTTRFLKGQ